MDRLSKTAQQSPHGQEKFDECYEDRHHIDDKVPHRSTGSRPEHFIRYPTSPSLKPIGHEDSHF